MAKKTAKTKTAKKPAKKVAKKTAKKAAVKKVAKKAAGKSAKKVAKKAASKVVKAKADKKPSKKVAKKVTAPKVAKEKTKKVAKVKTAKASKKNKAEEVAVETAAPAVEKKTAKKGKSKKNTASDTAELKELEVKVKEEINTLSAQFSWEDIHHAIATMDFFIDDKSDECFEYGCDNLRTTGLYCRMHYIANWTQIKKKQEVLATGQLEKLIQEIMDKYSTSQLESIVNDLADDKQFFKALSQLNIASEIDFEDEIDFEGDDDDDDDDVIDAGKFTGTAAGAFDED